MAWQDRFTKEMVITTGDGTGYTVLTEPKYSKEIEYFGTDFSFVNIDGELIDKRKRKGRSFPLEFYFTGSDHLENSALFEASTLDRRPWSIQHPFYNLLVVQVMSIKFDNTESLDYTKITCIAKETIDSNGVTVSVNPVDVIVLKSVDLNSLLSAQPEITPTIRETQSQYVPTESFFKESKKIISDPLDAEDYFNAFNEANAAVNNFTAQPIIAMQKITAFITAPSHFVANVTERIGVLVKNFDTLHRTILGLTSVNGKRLYESQMVGTLSAMCNAAATPLFGNYANPQNALNISQILSEKMRQFKQDMDSLQQPNGGNLLFFIPQFSLSKALDELVYLTTSSLFEIALNGRKELSFVLETNSNVVLLAHRFYVLDQQDNAINEFISNNNIRYKEIALGLQKGRTVTYYV